MRAWLLLSVMLAVASSFAAAETRPRVADAAEKRDARAVVALLNQGVDVNLPQADGATALHWAAHWNELTILDTLIRNGADTNVANDYGAVPLFLAAANGSADAVDRLLKGGADANAAMPTGETVLMTAVRAGNEATVGRLLSAGARPNTLQSSKGQSALMWAAARQQVEIVQALIDAGADVNATSTTGFTPLMFAARGGSVGVSRLLLASGANPNAVSGDGSTPLVVATIRGHIDIVLMLLERGAAPDGNPAATGYTPLHWAAVRYENPLTNRFSGGKGDAVLSGEWEALAGIPDRAAKIALIKLLLARGADVNARTSRSVPIPSTYINDVVRPGTTPLFVAAKSGDPEVMRLLLAHGADPDARTPDGKTVFMAAAGEGAVVGTTKFVSDRVTESDRIAAMSVALEIGNDIEAQDRRGYRAMHFAALGEFQGIIKFLVAHGADLDALTNPQKEADILGSGSVELPGQSPLGLVESTYFNQTNRPETAEFLRSLGARSIGRVTLDRFVKQEHKGKPALATEPTR